jgi:hypothetical protein
LRLPLLSLIGNVATTNRLNAVVSPLAMTLGAFAAMDSTNPTLSLFVPLANLSRTRLTWIISMLGSTLIASWESCNTTFTVSASLACVHVIPQTPLVLVLEMVEREEIPKVARRVGESHRVSRYRNPIERNCKRPVHPRKGPCNVDSPGHFGTTSSA